MLFLDVSSYQGGIDFGRVKQSVPGLAGVWVKATEGTNYRNPFLKVQAENARKAGLRVGFYHFAHVDSTMDAAAEAAYFVDTVRALTTRRDLRPVLDLETPGPKLISPEGHVAWARRWNSDVKRRLGVGPLFYSYPAFIQWLNPAKPIGYGLWLASYSRNDGKEHPYSVPAPWRKVAVHQFSSRCRVAGCDGYVDLSAAKSIFPLLAHPVRGL